MSLSALRRALLPQNAVWRHLLITLAAVATIVVGLLAMHSLHLDSGHNYGHDTAVMTVVVAVGHGDAASADVVGMLEGGAPGSTVGHCPAGDCSPDHGMTAMACLLILLATGLLLATVLASTRWAPVRQLGLLKVVRAVALAPPIPPSLHVLSISRT